MNNRERFTVYHLMSEFTRDAYTRVETRLSAYTLVATVEASCLGEVFQLTNHIDSNWTENAEVIELFTPKDRTRSTSVGDIVSDENGHFHRVQPSGWMEVQMQEAA